MKDINYYKYVFVPNNNLMIVKGTPKANNKHPNSDLHVKHKRISKIKRNVDPLTVSIEIIDNKNNYKPYYLLIGNNVERVISNPSKVKSDSASIVISKDGDIISENKVERMEDFDSLGIYANEDMAIYKGDVKSKMQDDNIKLSSKKLELEESKLKINEDKVIISSKQVIQEDVRLDNERSKMVIDNEMNLSKLELERFKLNNAYDMALLDMDNKEIGMKQNAIKFNNDLALSNLAHNRDVEMFNLKSHNEKVKNDVSLLNGAIGLGKTIIGLF